MQTDRAVQRSSRQRTQTLSQHHSSADCTSTPLQRPFLCCSLCDLWFLLCERSKFDLKGVCQQHGLQHVVCLEEVRIAASSLLLARAATLRLLLAAGTTAACGSLRRHRDWLRWRSAAAEERCGRASGSARVEESSRVGCERRERAGVKSTGWCGAMHWHWLGMRMLVCLFCVAVRLGCRGFLLFFSRQLGSDFRIMRINQSLQFHRTETYVDHKESVE